MIEDKQALCAYSVSREGDDDRWVKIGLAVPHSDGKGFDVVLQALPLNARLVLRKQTADDKMEAERLSLADRVEAFERTLIEQCLVETGGKVSAVMERLDIPRRTLNEKMTRLGVDRRRFTRVARQSSAVEGVENGENFRLPR
jgi:DNA-binding NtrC family response regulator